MRNQGKKICSIVAATALALTALAGCGGKASYKGDELTAGYDSAAAVSSQGGFVVEKGDYVYFINGAEEYTASNKYGDVTKGALMRISKKGLAEGNETAQAVVPSLFAAQNFDAGIYIYGDYVYYATPTRDKNLKGEVENSYIDFKRAKLDGTEAPMKSYYFRLATNTANYRYVTVPGVDRNGDGEEDVFCMYEEDSALKSYNTATGENVVLVSGAKSSFFYDMKDPSDPNVYYTMSVVYDAESDNAQTAPYDQLYCVNAAARVESVDANTATYKVEGGRAYSFKVEDMKKANSDAKKNDEDEPYDLGDYTTYPYVNLGTLVLDGIGSATEKFTQYNNAAEKDTKREELQGYTYTITRNENGGVYFTRAEVVTNSSAATSTGLYYLANERGADWNTVSGNASNKYLDVVAQDTTNASDTALFEVLTDENGARTHRYLYLSNDNICRATAGENGVADVVTLAYNLSGATLWKTEGEYLYYYGTGTNGNSISRIKYTGEEEDYNLLLVTEEYEKIDVAYIDWNSSWYEPEFVGDVLLYSNATSYGAGSTAYNYIYAAKLGANADIKAKNEAYEAVTEYIGEFDDETEQALAKYQFRTDGVMTEETSERYDDELIAEIQAKFAATGDLKKETYFTSLIGAMKEDDADAIAEDWRLSLVDEEEETEEESGLPTWAIVLIVVGCVIVVAAGVVIPLVIVRKKKNAKKREEEATVNAYKRKKIDTTDDKTIDVYADDEAEEASETEEKVEE